MRIKTVRLAEEVAEKGIFFDQMVNEVCDDLESKGFKIKDISVYVSVYEQVAYIKFRKPRFLIF
jgi:hypothetical protein